VWPAGGFALPGHGLLGVLLAAAGLGVALAGVRAFVQARTTVDPRHPDRARVLVRHGIFRVTRNPMYLGFALILAGWSMWLAHIAGLAALLAFIVYIDTVQIPPEEAALRARFGRAFEAYAARVGRWL
jgi:protein-S-isoprenylcysteine O-methyltransferase Ste14